MGHWLRKRLSGWAIESQHHRHHLIEDFEGRRAFGLRPDFVLTHPDGRFIIADAKWKRLDAGKKHPPLGISQADLYQLYAYGHKYRLADGSCPELWLLYPEQEALPLRRKLKYEEGLEIELIGVKLGEDTKNRPIQSV